MRRYFLRIILVAWTLLWVNFIARDLFKKNMLSEYVALAKEDDDGKRAITYGKRLYELLKLANDTLPKGASFELAGIERLSLSWRRAIYLLYPHLEKKPGDYIIAYNTPLQPAPGYRLIVKIDEYRYILRRE